MLLAIIGASVVGNMLGGKGFIQASKGIIRSDQVFSFHLNPLTDFEIQKFCRNSPKFKGVCSRNTSCKIKDGTYGINLDESKSTGTHSIALYLNGDNVTHFDNFGVAYIPKEI